ncbi:unnamed protein product [Rhizoctonia solani]|uniref:Uncharacterized protein n=1 Tax=Rhizoctonia solani TaxID=456999 RepID=A0A8H3BAY5_9AGAM|nr:unnamed protein product [Rhizoctonia solani]
MRKEYAMHALRPVLLALSHPFLSFLLPPRLPVPPVFQDSYSHPLNDANVPVRQGPSLVLKTDLHVPHAMDRALNVPEKPRSVPPVREVAVLSMGNAWGRAQAEQFSPNPYRPTRRERPAYHVMPIVLPARDLGPPNVQPALPLVPSNHQTEDVSLLRLAALSPFSTRPPDRVERVMLDAQTVREQCVDSGCGETYLGLCLSALVTSTKTTTTVGLSPLHGALVGTSSIGFFALGLLVWRRRARKQRAARTAAFADTLPDNDTNRGRWEWGRVWRMRREEGWFSGLRLLISGLGLRRKRRTQFHREMSLRKLGGQGRQPNRDSEEDPRWRNLRPRREAPDSFVFDRPVIPAAPGTGQSWWRERDSMDSERGKAAEGAYGNINPESHFARTLSSMSGGSIRRPVIQRSETPEAERLEPDVTGASAHTFGVPPTIGRKASLVSHNNGLVDLKSNPTGSSTSRGMNRLASNQTGSDIQAGNWMLPNYTGMESVSTHFTGSVATQNTGLGIHPSQANSTLPLVGQQTGVSSVLSHRTGNSSVVFHHTGSSNSLSPHPTGASILVAQAGTRAAPGVPVSYAPFLDSSTNPQPRQPIRDGSNINPFSRTLAVTPRPSNESLMMSPPPQGIPSSPVWPGAVGGSYWYGSEPQGLQSQLKLGDKNPFRRI